MEYVGNHSFGMIEKTWMYPSNKKIRSCFIQGKAGDIFIDFLNPNRIVMNQLFRHQRKMPGLYRINNKIHLRAEVEHVFGEIKQFHTLIRDTERENKSKILLCSILGYNHKIMTQGTQYC